MSTQLPFGRDSANVRLKPLLQAHRQSGCMATVVLSPFISPYGIVEVDADGKARNFVLQMRAGRFHGFVVRQGDGVVGYGQLAEDVDDLLGPAHEVAGLQVDVLDRLGQ